MLIYLSSLILNPLKELVSVTRKIFLDLFISLSLNEKFFVGLTITDFGVVFLLFGLPAIFWHLNLKLFLSVILIRFIPLIFTSVRIFSHILFFYEALKSFFLKIGVLEENLKKNWLLFILVKELFHFLIINFCLKVKILPFLLLVGQKII